MYTLNDKLGAFKYANERMVLEQLSFIYTKWPHIASHIKWHVTRADPNKDYYYGTDFANKAIKTSVEITQSLCELMSCNSAKDNGLCTSSDTASLYWVGQNYTTPKVQCQPACFNLTKQTTVQSLPFEWHNNECKIIPPALQTFMEKPYFRSAVHYEDRVNDFTIGFDRDGTDLRYKYNKFYCDLYFGTWSDGACEPTWTEKVAGSILGHSIIKTAKLLSLYANTLKTRPIPPDVPALPTLPDKYKVANWLANIDTTWQVPNPHMTLSHAEVPFAALRPQSPQVNFDVVEHVTNAYEKIRTFLVNFLESLATKEFWQGVGIQIASDAALGGIKALLDFVAQKTIPAIITELASIGSDFSAVALSQAMSIVMANTAARFAITEMGQLIRGALTVMGEMASVVGYFVLIANILDVILTTFDFWHLEKQFSQDTLDRLTSAGIQEFNNKLGTRTPTLSLEVINALLIPRNEQIQIYTPKMIVHAYEYLFSLKTNSEGTPINHESINIHQFSAPIINQLTMQVTLHTPMQFTNYEAAHMDRILYGDSFIVLGVGLCALTVPFFFLKMYTTVAIIFILVLIAFYFNFNIRLAKNPKKLLAPPTHT